MYSIYLSNFFQTNFVLYGVRKQNSEVALAGQNREYIGTTTRVCRQVTSLVDLNNIYVPTSQK